jgi:hypothetical protein
MSHLGFDLQILAAQSSAAAQFMIFHNTFTCRVPVRTRIALQDDMEEA